MKIVIAGGHGQIAQHLERQLAARGEEVIGIIRDGEQAEALHANGATPVVLDMEAAGRHEVSDVLRGADAVVFAAGAGPGSGPQRKDTVDRGAAVLMAEAAELAGVNRYVMVSAMGAGTGSQNSGNETWDAYLDAKKAADDDLMARSFDWTILRPGQLTNDPGSGSVRLASSTGRGEVPREDVAAVIAALLSSDTGSGHVLELVAGPVPVAEAVAALG